MCEYEKNILNLLLEEKKRLDKIFTIKEAPYMRSLENGIQKAQKKLEDCEFEKCVDIVYKKSYEIPPKFDMRPWFDYYMKLEGCKKKD